MAKAEVKVMKDTCPWCAYENDDAKLGPIKKGKSSGKLVETLHQKAQCVDCGKIWRQQDLGKPWSYELERGERWAREAKARQLSGA